MPWKIEDVDSHKKGLTDKEKEQWVAVANSALESCMKDGGSEETCAISAIKQANGVVEKKSIEMTDKDSNEIRTIPNEDSEIRVLPNSRNIEGYGIVFNKDSQMIYENGRYFYERVLPESVNGVIENSDILCLLNHNLDRGVLARSDHGSGSLKIKTDSRGVKYSFESPKTSLGDELIENINRKDIKGSSFSFRIKSDGEKWTKRSDGTYLRELSQFSLINDFSPCYYPAYLDTSVALRSLEEFKNTTIGDLEIEVKQIPEGPVIKPVTEVEKAPKVKIEPKNSNNLKNNSMTITELRDLRAQAIEQNDKIFEAKKTENRDMTPDEEKIVAGNNQKIKEYDFEIETETRKQGKGTVVGPYFKAPEKETFSLMKAILAKVEQSEMPAVARDIFTVGKRAFRDAGINYSGDIVLPVEERAAPIDASVATHGVEIVATEKKDILPPLVDKLVFTQAGATYMTGLVGNVSIPSYSGTTVSWKAEVSGADEGEGTFKDIEFSPKRLTGYIIVSKQFLLQDGVGAERLLLDNLSNAVARKLESTILGVAAGSATQPEGMGWGITSGGGVAHIVPTYAKMVALESAIDTANALVGNLAYITNASGRGLLKSIDKGVSNDTGDMLCSETNQVNGYPLLVTNSCSAAAGASTNNDLLVFGNWKDLCIAQWGGYDITVDPYTLSEHGQVKIVINAYFDAKGLRGAGDLATDYAVSFAATSIKAT